MREIKEEENELNDLEQKESLLGELNKYIKEVKKTASKGPKLPEFHNRLIGAVEDLLYANLIINFIDNLIINFIDNPAAEENRKEANITKIDVVNIESEFEELINACKEDSDSRDDIDSKVYQAFKEKLNTISKNSYMFLQEVEKYANLSSCEDSITRFKKEVCKQGEEFKVNLGLMNGEDGLYGISLDQEGLEGLDDEQDFEGEDDEQMKGFNDGYEQGIKDGRIWFNCIVCGEPCYIQPNDDVHREIIEYLKNQKWGHKECIDNSE